MTLLNRTIILGVTGSIAAYKAADLASGLTKRGANVFCVMTREAAKIIGPIALQTLSRNPVLLDLWEEGGHWQPGHIELADKADLMLVAPATANIIACMANGLAPDALTSIYLATLAPVMIAPAMNGKMLNHPATAENLNRLRSRGHIIIDPQSWGMLACGYEGAGKLATVDSILAAVEAFFSPSIQKPQ